MGCVMSVAFRPRALGVMMCDVMRDMRDMCDVCASARDVR